MVDCTLPTCGRPGSRDRLRATLLLLLLSASLAPAAVGQSVTLYENDFESPNVTPERLCGFALDIRPINDLYGTVENQFAQVNTVETVLVNDTTYTDSSGVGGNYAIGMLSVVQDDRLALTFDSQGFAYINVRMDVSSIDVNGCGGPFGIGDPTYRLSLIDSPNGVFTFNYTSVDVLDEVEIGGTGGPAPYTFDWTRKGAGLSTTGATDGIVTVVWDLLQSGYAAFDNLLIEASDTPVAAEDPSVDVPEAYVLTEVYPNPFNPRASFQLQVAQPQQVRLTLHNALGVEVARLHDGLLQAGEHRFELRGHTLPSGIYLVRAAGEHFRATRRAVLLK